MSVALGGAAQLATTRHGDATVEAGSFDAARLAASALSGQIERTLVTVGYDVGLAAENALLKGELNPDEVREFFGRWRKLHEHYTDILVADRRGRIQATASGHNSNADISGSGWFAQSLRGVVVGEADGGRQAGAEALRNVIVAAPVVAANRTVGVVAVQLGPQWIEEPIEVTRRNFGPLMRGLSLEVLNASGRILTRSGPTGEAEAAGGRIATVPVGELDRPGLGWVVSARSASVPPFADAGLTVLLAYAASIVLAGLFGWFVGARLAGSLGRIRAAAAADDVAVPARVSRNPDIRQLAEEVRAAAIRSKGRERMLQETRTALGRSRARARAIKSLDGAACWDIDLGRKQISWTECSATDADSAVERVCDLDQMLSRIASADREPLSAALKRAATEPSSTHDLTVKMLPDSTSSSGRRLKLRVASAAQAGGLASRVHVLSRESNPIALLAPAGEAKRREFGESRTDEPGRAIVDGIVHDVNDALTTVMTSLATLKRLGVGHEKSLQLADLAMRGAMRGASMTRRVIALARKEDAGSSEADVSASLEDLVDFIRASVLPGRMVALSVHGQLPRLLCSERQFEIAILNLMSDATASLGSNEPMSIRAEAWRLPSGVPMADHAGVRVVVTAPHDFTAGRGSEAAKATLEDVGGSMTLVSTPQANTITLWFPSAAVRSHLPEAGEGAKRRQHILLVEPDTLVRAATEAGLSEMGHAVTQAASASQAIQLLAEGRDYDNLILAQILPEMTGVALAEIVSRTHPRIGIILTGARGQFSANAYAFSVLHKPFHLDDVERLLRDVEIRKSEAA